MTAQSKAKRDQELKPETVLIMQGGGSLGAYECGVYKTLTKHNIEFDVIAGTSIGAINAAIIVGAKNDNPAGSLEDFWYSIAENMTSSPVIPDNLRPYFSSMYSAFWGNPNVFIPVWLRLDSPCLNYYTLPHLYDIIPLKNTLESYIDFTKLHNSDRPRLIITSTDIMKGESVTFDSKHLKIDSEHVISCAGFPFYGISWTQKDGRYLWDGALQSNTPLREVIDASPKCNKNVYVINLFPKNHKELPKNLFECWHRARDITHTDKTNHNVRMSKVISKYLMLLKEMHDIIYNEKHLSQESKIRFRNLEPMYHKLALDRGAIIENITRIERSEETHFLFEDADFSIGTIKKLIAQGEKDAETILTKQKE